MGYSLITKGAEGDIYSAKFSDIFFESASFSEVIVKRRIPKGYRIPELDLQLRRQRTISEAKIIHDSRAAGANVPIILGVWTDQCILIMEKIEGIRLKELLNQPGADPVPSCVKAGRQLGLLHKHGIVHGDPTTSNMIMKGDEVYLIDFGLAEYSDSVEKRAVDLHLMKTAMKSTHFHRFRPCYAAAVEGYCLEMGEAAQAVLERSRLIEKRGRYVER